MQNRVSSMPSQTVTPVPARVQGEQSTLFSDWLKLREACEYVSVDDVIRTRVIRTDGPQKTAAMSDKAVRYDVQEMVRAFDPLPNEVRNTCYEYARAAHVFPVSLFTLNRE